MGWSLLGGSSETKVTEQSSNVDIHPGAGSIVAGDNSPVSVYSTTTDAGAVKAASEVAASAVHDTAQALESVSSDAFSANNAALTHAANLGSDALDFGRRVADNSLEMYGRGLDNAQIANAGALNFAGTALDANTGVLESALKFGSDTYAGFSSTLANTVFDLSKLNSQSQSDLVAQAAKNESDFATRAFDAVSSVTAANTASGDTQVLNTVKYLVIAAVVGVLGFALLKSSRARFA